MLRFKLFVGIIEIAVFLDVTGYDGSVAINVVLLLFGNFDVFDFVVEVEVVVDFVAVVVVVVVEFVALGCYYGRLVFV